MQPDVLEQIRDQVDRGAGFLMIGGYASFGGDPDVKGSGDWKGTIIERMLPVDLSVRGQVESRTPLYGIVMLPTEDGLRLYSRVVGLSGGDKDAEIAAWKSMQSPLGLQGANRLAGRRAGATRSCWPNRRRRTRKTNQPYPLLVERTTATAGCWPSPATPRTAGFTTATASGSTTASGGRWCCGWPARTRARTRCASTPDVRSISVGDDLGFSLHLRSKNGQDVKDADYEVEVIGPNGEHTRP